jgi:hypothetical protein
MGSLRPPTDDHPASMLRWVRRLQLVMVAAGLALALLLWAADLPVWWLGLVVAGMALLSLATIGDSIRRAEQHGPNDPATRPARRRRAERLTLSVAGAVTAIGVAVGLAVEGPGLALALALPMAVGVPLGFWVFRRWMQ